MSTAPRRSGKLSARLWWATLPYAGWVGWSDTDGEPAPWWAYPLAWLNRLAAAWPWFEAFEPMPPIVCDCDECGGLYATCPRCKRGAEACQWCENMARIDWEVCCDCGLYDFGDHLLDCEARNAFAYVVAADYGGAQLPRGSAGPTTL